MKHVLMITDVDFWNEGAGHRMRIMNLVAYLPSCVKLTVVYVGIVDQKTEKTVKDSLTANLFILDNEKQLNAEEYGKRLKFYLKNKRFDFFLIEYIHNSYFLAFLPEASRTILDAHDIISDRTNDFHRFNYVDRSYEISRELEYRIFKMYDYVLFLSEPDYKKMRIAIDPDKIILCPHPVKLKKHQVRRSVNIIGFVASEYLPNRDAAMHFICEMWPTISAKYDVQFFIYGNLANTLGHLANHSKIQLRGYIPNINTIYEEADIIINPVRFGAGLKIKNVEALAHGKPLVTSSHGARGLETGQMTAFLVADNPNEFTAHVETLINNYNLRVSLTKKALLFAQHNFSEVECYQALIQVINKD